MEYEEVEKMIHSLAWSFAQRNTGVNVSDLESLGDGVFMDARRTHNPMKGRFSTYLFKALRNEFAREVNGRDVQMGFRGEELEQGEVQAPVTWMNPARIIEIKDQIDSMSEDARTITNIFLESPAEVLRITGQESPREIRGILIKFLHVRGWGWSRIYQTLKEVKQTVRSL